MKLAWANASFVITVSDPFRIDMHDQLMGEINSLVFDTIEWQNVTNLLRISGNGTKELWTYLICNRI